VTGSAHVMPTLVAAAPARVNDQDASNGECEAARREREASRIGRKARRKGTVVKITPLALPAKDASNAS
jgi:hypothetical protein